MDSIFDFNLLLPLGLLLLQTFLFLFAGFALLKKMKIVVSPYAGLELSQVITAIAFLFGLLLITTANVPALFQAFKTYQNAKANITPNTFSKFSQFFLVVLIFQLVYLLSLFLLTKTLQGFKTSKQEIVEGSIPVALLAATLSLGLSIVLQIAAREVIQYIIPQYIFLR